MMARNMSKKPAEKPVTEAVFTQEIKALHEKIDSSVKRISNELLKTKDEVQDIKRTMSTKDDVNTILNRLDSFTINIETFDRKVLVHDKRLADAEAKITGHETRLVTVESK